MLRANKLKCNAVAHLLHRNVKAASEEKSSQFSNPSGLSKTGNLLRCGRFAVCAYTCTSRALHLACFGQSQNLGSKAIRLLPSRAVLSGRAGAPALELLALSQQLHREVTVEHAAHTMNPGALLRGSAGLDVSKGENSISQPPLERFVVAELFE